MARTETHGTTTGALNVLSGLVKALLASRQRILAIGTSAAATAQTITIIAPGAGKRLHLSTLIAFYSDGSDNEITISLTQGGAKVVRVKTGAQLALTGIDLVGDENTAITIDAPAGAAGVTSEIAAEYWTEEI